MLHAGDCDHQDRYGNQFVWELVRHSVGEELVVYPAIEKRRAMIWRRGNWKEYAVWVLTRRMQWLWTCHYHLHIGQRIAQNLSESKSLWPRLCRSAAEALEPLSEHIEEEEDRDLPALEEKLRALEGESASMAKSFGRTKAFDCISIRCY